MNFINHFNEKGNSRGEPFKGTAIFCDGFLTIRLPNTLAVVEKGYVEGGFGVVVKPQTPRKSPYTLICTEIDLNYLPNNLRGRTYKFRIEAEYVSENEIIFRYDRAKMMNHK